MARSTYKQKLAHEQARARIAEKQKGERSARQLDRYKVNFRYIKNGDEMDQYANGYKKMREVRSAQRKRATRAYRVHTVNVTKGRPVS